jgi:hypothetical protein
MAGAGGASGARGLCEPDGDAGAGTLLIGVTPTLLGRTCCKTRVGSRPERPSPPNRPSNQPDCNVASSRLAISISNTYARSFIFDRTWRLDISFLGWRQVSASNAD